MLDLNLYKKYSKNEYHFRFELKNENNKRLDYKITFNLNLKNYKISFK